VSQATSFCSRCGFLLSSVAELLLTDGVPGGVPLATTKKGAVVDSPRRRGVKQGAFLIMLMLVVAPLFGLIFGAVLRVPPWPAGVIVLLFGGGGLLRAVYALMFESKCADGALGDGGRPVPGQIPVAVPGELAAGDASLYISPEHRGAGAWLDTNDLQPHSVTDPTTRLLEKDSDQK
jgi:hypothetical protein